MTQFFVVTQVILLGIGFILLLYYARKRDKLYVEKILQDKKVLFPLAIKLYTVVLLLWLAFLILQVILALLST